MLLPISLASACRHSYMLCRCPVSGLRLSHICNVAIIFPSSSQLPQRRHQQQHHHDRCRRLLCLTPPPQRTPCPCSALLFQVSSSVIGTTVAFGTRSVASGALPRSLLRVSSSRAAYSSMGPTCRGSSPQAKGKTRKPWECSWPMAERSGQCPRPPPSLRFLSFFLAVLPLQHPPRGLFLPLLLLLPNPPLNPPPYCSSTSFSAVALRLIQSIRTLQPLCCRRAKTVVSNATRWGTFQNLLPKDELPEGEKTFLSRYQPSPSFVSIHMGERPAGPSARSERAPPCLLLPDHPSKSPTPVDFPSGS